MNSLASWKTLVLIVAFAGIGTFGLNGCSKREKKPAFDPAVDTCQVECDCLRKRGAADGDCMSSCQKMRSMGQQICSVMSPSCCPK